MEEMTVHEPTEMERLALEREQTLRQREAADSHCYRYPRLKPGDDVSGIVAVF